MKPRALLLAGGALALACAATTGAVQTQKLPDGSVRLICPTSLQKCLDSAVTLCKGGTYDVLRARDQRDRFGGELGQSNVEVRSSEAVIHCAAADDAPPPPEPTPEPTWKLPPPTAAQPPKPAPAASATPPPPERTCVPGATQACVGPGACQGGQACLPSGTGFGPCDCGPLPPAQTAPAPPSERFVPAPLPTPSGEPLRKPPPATRP